jgi:hypothetical protein
MGDIIRKIKVLILVAAGLALVQGAGAQTNQEPQGSQSAVNLPTTTLPTTTAIKKTDLPKRFLEDIRLNVFSWSYGPGLANPTRNQPNLNGEPTLEAGSWTLMNVNGPAFGDWRVAVIPGFVTSATRENEPFRLMDSTIGLARVVAETPDWSYFVRAEAILMTSERSQELNREYGAQILNVFSYRPVGSSVGFDQIAVPVYRVYSDGKVDSLLYLNPMLSFHTSDTFRWVALSEHFLGVAKGKNPSDLKRTDPDLFGVGFRKTWNFADGRNFFLQPYLNLYTQKFDADNFHLALWFGGRLF